ncbi:MAG: FtsX-like permease family protein [Nitrospina sp.]|nr:FtsX-like permease family protein [Nitrospina sp.]MBT6143670.1 FtsX-like permease family protein [bacterium]MBT6717696.1 FtsX-like permease family protein [Nitrospina sp.]
MTVGVMIGIASLTVIVAIGFGIKVKVLDRIANLGFGPESFSVMAGAGQMFFSRSKNTTSMSLEDAEDLLALPTVRLVVPRQRKRMQIINKKEFTSTRVYGVTPDWQRARGWHVVDGVFLSDSDLDRKKKVVVLGATPVRKLFNGEDPIGKMVRLQNNFYEVIGLLQEKGLTESGYDPDDRALIPLTTSMARLTRETHLHSIKVVTLDASQVPETMEAVKQVLRRNHNLSILSEDDFRFVTPEGIMEWVTESAQAMNRMLILISTVSLLVGGVVIMNILLVSIRERVREIGIRRCFGARKSDITLQFLFESVLVSLLGGILGIGLGLSISFGLNRFDILPVQVTWEPFVLSFVFCTLIGLIFGIHPARKAALMSPEESIRA